MAYLLTILQPHVAIILNAGVVHGAAFDRLVIDRNPGRRMDKIKAEIAKEKMKLAASLDPGGFAIINIDQKELRDLTPSVRARLIKFGKRAGADLRLLKMSQNQGFRLQINYQSQNYLLELDSLFEPSFIYTFGAAIAAGAALGISPDKSADALRGFVPPRGRLRLFGGVNGTHLIDSTYNASPETMLSALTLLHNSAGRAHKIAVLGDMRELGLQSKLAHKNLADWVMKCADECVLFGPITAEFTLPVLESAHFPVRHFDRMDDLNQYLSGSVKPKSWILFKGSQNTIFLERAVDHLLANRDDFKHLARRGRYWDKIRMNSK